MSEQTWPGGAFSRRGFLAASGAAVASPRIPTPEGAADGTTVMPVTSTRLPAAAARPDVDWVNPLTGALTTSPDTACGKTFPGAVVPFGLVQLSPDTVSGGATAVAIPRT
ncbi:hypothetical protein ACFVHS_37670 [Streptomyces sp. NPDC057746]|uniref:hypothetical protein n=1 Tax=Streptomyces sp. NPDC057746 TaxID=3346237 RepID=UPI0036AAA3A1